MATSISDNADLLASGFITTNQLKRLTPREWYDGNDDPDEWTYWHKEAWSEILRAIKDRHDVDEDDLSDTSELLPCAVHYVLFLAFATGEHEKRSDLHMKLYRDRMAVIRPTTGTSGTSSLIASGRGIPLARA